MPSMTSQQVEALELLLYEATNESAHAAIARLTGCLSRQRDPMARKTERELAVMRLIAALGIRVSGLATAMDMWGAAHLWVA